MPEQIRDGSGKGYLVGADKENRLLVHATVLDEASFISQKNEELYSWTTNHDVVADEYVLCLVNNNQDKYLCIETIRCCNDVAFNLSIGFGTWSTVGGGAEVVGANAKSDSGGEAQATCHITATNFTQDSVPLLQSVVGAGSERTYRPEGKILLGYRDALYIKTSEASTSYCSAVIWGFFKEVE